MTLTIGSLFSGIGGLDLGLERAGMRVVWQSEIDPYASRVLAKHWPDVPNLGDITKVDWDDVERPDLVCGGYPCQPFSLAGVRRGESDPRHLWPHFARAIRHLRPRYALLENVPGHRSLGFGRVLGDLAEIGYDCEWFSIPAAAVGAPHLRWRLFAIAYPHGDSQPERAVDAEPRPRIMVPDTGSTRRRQDSGSTPGDEGPHAGWPTQDDHVVSGDGAVGDVADTDGLVGSPRGSRERRPGEMGEPGTLEGAVGCGGVRTAGEGSTQPGLGRALDGLPERLERPWGPGWEDGTPRVATGIPHRVDRLRCLGNAVVPQVAEWVGRQIMSAP